jgi:hypothetical protein
VLKEINQKVISRMKGDKSQELFAGVAKIKVYEEISFN